MRLYLISNVKSVIAKIDTGATLASIDAADIKIVTRDKVKYVKFKVMKRNNTVRKTSAPLEGYKRIKVLMVMLREDRI